MLGDCANDRPRTVLEIRARINGTTIDRGNYFHLNFSLGWSAILGSLGFYYGGYKSLPARIGSYFDHPLQLSLFLQPATIALFFILQGFNSFFLLQIGELAVAMIKNVNI